MSEPIEDPPTAASVQAMDQAAREALVRAAATEAFASSGCRCIELLVPHALRHLKAINPGEGAPMLVAAVDDKGTIRQGLKGAMTATELLRELRLDKEFDHMGWGKSVRTRSKTTF